MRWRGTRGIGSIVLLLLAAMLAAGPSITTNGSGHSREISLTGSGSTAPCVSILNNTTIDAVVSSVYGRAQSQPGGLSSPIPNETTAESEIAGAFPQVCNQPLFQSLVQNWSPGNFSVEFALSSAWAWTNFTFAYEQWSQSCPGSQGLVLCGTLDWWSLDGPKSGSGACSGFVWGWGLRKRLLPSESTRRPGAMAVIPDWIGDIDVRSSRTIDSHFCCREEQERSKESGLSRANPFGSHRGGRRRWHTPTTFRSYS